MSTVGLFSPRRDDQRAEWRVIYELVENMQPGDVLTYDRMLDALERPPEDKPVVYAAVARAARETRRRRNRTLAVVRTVGYRMLAATEHEAQAEVHRAQSSRRMRLGLEVLQSTDLADLTPEQRQRAMAVTMVMSGLASAIDSIEERQRRTETALATVNQRLSALEGGS
jgi:hypothetical protein